MLIEAITALINAGATYYARQQALPEKRKRDICAHLSSLLGTLERIALTGRQIEDHLGTRIMGRDQMMQLAALLEAQTGNLQMARRDFEYLASIFQVQLPEISGLVIHLRGKKDRMEIIYTAAREVARELREPLARWESSQMLGPEQLLGILAQSRNGIEISRRDPQFWEGDPDFVRIVAAIPELRGFVQGYCKPEHLV